MKTHQLVWNVLLTLLLIVISFLPQNAVAAEAEGIYVIFDASGSMWDRLPDRSLRIDAARTALQEFLKGDFGDSEIALRIYGHRRKGDCQDSQLVVPFAPYKKAGPAIARAIADVQPTGKTPITLSLQQALKDFGDRPGSIILISDGIESCDADPCALIKAWKEKNVRIRVHVVGLGLDEKSKASLSCISGAAGTKYHDASTAADLAKGLSTIREQAVPGGIYLNAVDGMGRDRTAEGTLSRASAPPVAIRTHARNHAAPGDYTMTAGMTTLDGKLYRPVEKRVNVGPSGGASLSIKVEVPPSVKARFTSAGKEQEPAGLIEVYGNGATFGKFRAIDEVFLPEGTYELRTKTPLGESAVAVTLKEGDRLEPVFDFAQTVHVTLDLKAAGSGLALPGNFELWGGGVKLHSVHRVNGTRVAPGKYSARLVNDLTAWAADIVVTAEEKQRFDLTAPAGHIVVRYARSDGSAEKDKRYFLGAGPTLRGRVKQSGEKIPLTPGTYNIVGWDGEYDSVVVELKAGDAKEIVLKARR